MRFQLSFLLMSALLLVVADRSLVASDGSDECESSEAIAQVNQGLISEAFRINGEDAYLFLAADPAMLEFQEDFDLLMANEIDEVIVWRHKRRKRLGMAVPFSDGCAVKGYGEPDIFEKMTIMRALVREVRGKGIDHPDVLARISELVTFRERYAFGEIISTSEDIDARSSTLLARISQNLKRED